MSAPIDLEVRTRATGELDRSMALSAGAGSGKTSVLSERIVALLAAGREPARVAAITFTEKAAAELRDRVRATIERRSKSDGEPRLARAIERFHEMTISTVHGFCRRLLELEPLGASACGTACIAGGWAPGTEIVAFDLAGLMGALAAFRGALRDRDPRLLGLVEELVTPAQLEAAIARLLASRDLVPYGREGGIDWAAAHAELVTIRDQLEGAAARCRKPADCKLLANNEMLRQRLGEWCGDPENGALEALLSREEGKLQGGKVGDWPDGSKDAFTGAIKALRGEWRTMLRERAHGEVVALLREVVVPRILEERRAQGVATFDDLLFRASELLRDAGARTRLSARFDAILIDEVQDTDPVQAEIAMWLARDPALENDWKETAPRAGALFAVGDPKQSIYRFRRADVDVWRDLARSIAKDGHAAGLVQNFRSVPGIVRWTSHVFADMPAFEAQEAWRGDAELDPIVVIDANGDEGDPKADATREADVALRHLRALIEAGARVVDRDTGALRPLRWGDVMLLVPRWSGADAIAARFLEAGVACVVDSGNQFFEDPLVKGAIAALAAMGEPADTDATLDALRGLFGLTYEDVARHVAAGGSLRATVREQPAGAVTEALVAIRETRLLREGSWVPVLDALLERTRAQAVWSLRRDGRVHLVNVEKLRVLVRELEREARSPLDVVEELKKLARAEDDDRLPRLAVDPDAVRLTTVYGAKGLEAPVAVLIDLERTVRTPSAIAERERGVLHLKIGELQPPGWDVTKENEKHALDAEQRRLVYVGATRARDQLVVISRDKANLLTHLAGGWVATMLADETKAITPGVRVRVIRGDALPPAPSEPETFPGHDAEIDAVIEAPAGKGDPEGEARAIEVRETVRTAVRACAKWKSVGELVAGRRFESSGEGVGRVGGTVIHRAMQLLDLRLAPAELAERAPSVVRALADDAGLSSERAEACVERVLRMLAHPVIEKARAAGEHWKEVPFAFHERGRVIAGTIDLCFPLDAGRTRWMVVDWKSDLPREGHPTRVKYQEQLGYYAKALLATVTPCTSVEQELVGPYVSPGEESDPLELVHEALRPALERLVDAGASVPDIGIDVGEPIVATVECAWSDRKLALALDLAPSELVALRGQGWNVIDVATTEPGWPDAAIAQVAHALGLEVVGVAIDEPTAEDREAR